MYRNVLFALTIALHSQAYAQFAMHWDVLDPSDGVDQPPESLIVLGLYFDVAAPTDSLNVAGVYAQALEGSELLFLNDPNSPLPFLTNPGLDNRFVTFFSEPRGRFNTRRYAGGRAYSLGSLCPPAIIPDASPTHVDVAFAIPPGERLPGQDGWIFRITLDVEDTWFQDRSEHPVEIFVGNPPDTPGEYIPVLVSQCPGDRWPGTLACTYADSEFRGFDWWLGARIPEPATVLLLLGLSASRRRCC